MIAILIVLFACLQGPGEEELARAEAALRAGDHALAFALYEELAASGESVPGAVFFNLGNCAWRLERPALAVFHWRRAALRMPGDPDVAFNLRMAERRLGLDADRAPPIGSFERRLRRLLPLALGAVVLLKLVGLLGIVLLRRRPALRAASAFALVLGVVGAGLIVRVRFWPEAPIGVVLTSRAAVRLEPHEALPAIFYLRAGECVKIPEGSDRWVRVVDSRGTGWVERPVIGISD